MDTKPSSSPPDRRSLYADPSIFQVAVRTTDDGWIQMTLEVNPEGTQGVAFAEHECFRWTLPTATNPTKSLPVLVRN
jgi:hypothetical protein